MGSGPLPLSPGSGAPSYLGGPIAMNQDREGVVGQVPRSDVAHFKLEHDVIWGSESTVPPSVTPEAKLRGRQAGFESQLSSSEHGIHSNPS